MLIFAVAGSMLAIGGVHVVTVLVLLCALAAGSVVLVWDSRPSRKTWAAMAPAAGIAALAAYSAVQAIPLPFGLLERIAPTTADVWAHSLDALREPHARMAPLSLDPGASLVEAAKWSIYAVVFGLSAWIAARRGVGRPIQIVFACAVVLAIVTLAHGLVGAQKVFGVYVPHDQRTPWHTGPLLNPNNLSGYLNLGIVLGLGLLVGRRLILPRGAVALGVALLEAANVIAASRAGFVAMVIGVLALATVVAPRLWRQGMRAARARVLATAGALVFGAVLAGLGISEQAWAELLDQSTLKLSMLLWSKPMISDYRFFGIGRGAFESVFAAYSTYPGHQVFTHAENFPSQWAAEWGLPVGLAALLGLLWLMRPGASRIGHSTMAAATWCGVLAILLQNLFDLALEVPAVCIALATVLGAQRGASVGRRTHRGDAVRWRWRAGRRTPALALGFVSFTLALTVWSYGLSDLMSERSLVRASVLDYAGAPSPTKRAETDAVLLGAMRRHPAEPYFPLMAAFSFWATHDNRAIFGIERSLERGYVNGRAHLLLAEVMMAQHANGQARLELRHAVDDDSSLIEVAAPWAAQISADDAELLEAIPQGPAGVEMLMAASNYVQLGRQLTLLEDASARMPRLLELHERLSERYLGALFQSGSDPCGATQKTWCEERASVHIGEVERLRHPDQSEGLTMRARLLVLEGRGDDAVALLTLKCPKMADRLACMSTLARIMLGLGHVREFDELLRGMAAAPCGSVDGDCPGYATGIGDLFLARTDWANALTQYSKAAELAPTAERWAKVGEAASRLGLHVEALHALLNASRMSANGRDPEVASRIAKERRLAPPGPPDP
jgi:hypothetical protein